MAGGPSVGPAAPKKPQCGAAGGISLTCGLREAITGSEGEHHLARRVEGDAVADRYVHRLDAILGPQCTTDHLPVVDDVGCRPAAVV